MTLSEIATRLEPPGRGARMSGFAVQNTYSCQSETGPKTDILQNQVKGALVEITLWTTARLR